MMPMNSIESSCFQFLSFDCSTGTAGESIGCLFATLVDLLLQLEKRITVSIVKYFIVLIII